LTWVNATASLCIIVPMFNQLEDLAMAEIATKLQVK
jgi:hypothetical protein